MNMVQCPWCLSEKIALHKLISYGFQIDRYICKCCKTMWMAKMPNKKKLDDIYKMFLLNEINKSTAFGSTNERIAKSIIKASGISSGFGDCLDYGAGQGQLAKTLINMSSEENDSVSIYEPYSDVKSSICIFNDWRDVENKKFDWVFMVEVVEHLSNPIDELMKIRKVLKPNGKLIITTPNSRGLQALSKKVYWRESLNPTHLTLFSEQSLRVLAEKAGYSSVERIKKKIEYKYGWKQHLLTITQLLGVSGGLHMVFDK